MARARIPLVIIGQDGLPAQGAECTIVNREDGVEAPIYTTEGGGAVLGIGTTETSEYGVPDGWLEDGEYACTVTGTAGVNPTPIPFEIITWTTLKAALALVPPVGVMMPFEGDPATVAAPYFFCDGSEIAAAAYPVLAARWGTGGASRHGAAAAGKVKLPDTRGRSLFGSYAGAAAADRFTGAPGDAGGESEHALSEGELASHTHADDIAFAAAGGHDHGGVTGGMNANNPHDHAVGNQGTGAYSTGSTGYVESNSPVNAYGPFQRANITVSPKDIAHGHSISAVGDHSHAKSGGVEEAGGGFPHNNMPPHVVVEGFIIRAG